jgi:hypothetical protein
MLVSDRLGPLNECMFTISIAHPPPGAPVLILKLLKRRVKRIGHPQE